MAEEAENKPKFILNKQKNDKPSQPKEEKEVSQEKKKVVVRRKPVVVAKTNDANAKDKKPTSENAEGKKNSQNGNGQANSEKKETASKSTTTFELSPPRPNIKQGNLADKPKGNNRQNNNGNRRDGGNRDGQSREGGRGFDRQRREGGFTGAQAREGYQNRNDRNNGNHQGQGKGQFNRNGKGDNSQGKGQFNRNGGQNRGPGGQGGGNQNRGQGGNQQNRQGFAGNRSGFVAAPAPMEENKKASSKKTFVKKKTIYSKKDKEIIYFIVNRFQINKLKNIVHDIDESAFISLQEVADIIRKKE